LTDDEKEPKKKDDAMTKLLLEQVEELLKADEENYAGDVKSAMALTTWLGEMVTNTSPADLLGAVPPLHIPVWAAIARMGFDDAMATMVKEHTDKSETGVFAMDIGRISSVVFMLGLVLGCKAMQEGAIEYVVPLGGEEDTEETEE
jgi:hypothetical protein